MGEVDYKKIGLFIKENRKKLKLTQKELGEKIGKTESSIRKYEKGLIQIPNDVLEKIAKVFNINVLEILANETAKNILNPHSLSKKLWNEIEKIDFPDKSNVENYIDSFCFMLKTGLITLNFNISDDDKIKLLEDLEKYYHFLMSDYKKKITVAHELGHEILKENDKK